MSDEMYSLCAAGTGSCNLGRACSTLNEGIFNWLRDFGATNIYHLGHRRWLLNPAMGKTGVGYAFESTAMSAFDSSGTGTQTRVVWPAQQTPIDYIDPTTSIQDAHYPEDVYFWSVSTGKTETKNDIKVTLTRTRDNRTWTFSSDSDSDSKNSGFFNVNNTGYGLTGCVIFSPNNVLYRPGDKYDVTVTGTEDGTINYSVEFFSLVPVTSITFPKVKKTDLFVGNGLFDMRVTIKPSNASEKRVVYKSSNTKVMTIDSQLGYVEIKRAGTTTITASVDGKTITKTLEVPRVQLDSKVFSYKDKNKKPYGNNRSYTYTGKAYKPKILISYCWEPEYDWWESLKEGKDYTVTYRSNQNIGKAYADVKGIGNYKGTHHLSFKILPDKVKKVTLKAAKQKVTVGFSKVKGTSTYQIYVKQAGKKARIINAKGKKTIKKLKSKKQATIKVRAYKKVSGKMYYGKWSEAKKVIIK